MKRHVFSHLHSTKALEKYKAVRVCDLLRKSINSLTTYNQIMAFMGVEQNQDKLEFIFVCPEDASHSFVFQYLPLFCKHFGIELVTLPQGSRSCIESALARKYVLIVGVKKEDPVCMDLVDLLSS